jgi:hypothetical protein
MKEAINPKRCPPGIYKVTLKDVAVAVDKECNEEEIIELTIETIKEHGSQDAPLLIVHKLHEVNVKPEEKSGENIVDHRFRVFADRVRSLLDRWQKFNDVDPSKRGIQSIKGCLAEINDDYTRYLMEVLDPRD